MKSRSYLWLILVLALLVSGVANDTLSSKVQVAAHKIYLMFR